MNIDVYAGTPREYLLTFPEGNSDGVEEPLW